ncbi:hypothetical protein [Clostridium sp. CF012]|nr:hypothetical protein [Clostridium sp. CF012]MBU3145737.1 hypothetical protein [Clostridium sp. CF012]
MSDEYIRDILIALINKGQVYLGASNKEIAESIAEFITTLRNETKIKI